MLVENAVQVIIVRSLIAFQLRTQSSIGMVDSSGIVVSLPELDRSHVARDKDSTAQERVKWR